MALEYIAYGNLSEKMDVYGYGVLLLEIISEMLNRGMETSEDTRNLISIVKEEKREPPAPSPAICNSGHHHLFHDSFIQPHTTHTQVCALPVQEKDREPQLLLDALWRLYSSNTSDRPPPPLLSFNASRQTPVTLISSNQTLELGFNHKTHDRPKMYRGENQEPPNRGGGGWSDRRLQRLLLC
ncbi:hypothetical protein R6Q59_023650 [Mikania micrantha]